MNLSGNVAQGSEGLTLVEVASGCYHGVVRGETIYRVWPHPLGHGWGASYHSNNRFVAKAKTLKEMHAILKGRYIQPTP